MSTSQSRRHYHHGDLRTALLRAGREILEAGGTGALSLREVARRAGVSAMAPYRHFPDRAGLLAAIAAEGFRAFAACLGDADRATDPRAALLAQGAAYVGFAIGSPAQFRLMFGPELPRDDPDLAMAQAAAYGVLADRVANLVTPERREDAALACWSMMHGLAMLALDGRLLPGSAAPTVLAERVGALLLAGLAARETP